MREGQQNLGSAQTQITCLKETQEKLRIELDATRARVRETSNLLTDLQVRRTRKIDQVAEFAAGFTENQSLCLLLTFSEGTQRGSEREGRMESQETGSRF